MAISAGLAGLIGAFIGAGGTIVATHLHQSRDIRWQYHKIKLERIELITQLAIEVAEHYRPRADFWFNVTRDVRAPQPSEIPRFAESNALTRMDAMLRIYTDDTSQLRKKLVLSAQELGLHEAAYMLIISRHYENAEAEWDAIENHLRAITRRLRNISRTCDAIIKEISEQAKRKNAKSI